MARMYPPDGPHEGLASQPLNKAEPVIYTALRDLLGDASEYIVFHNVKWFTTQPNGGNQPAREMDFLIASRRYGLLIVEAKSAEIELVRGRGGRLDEVHKAYFEQAKTREKELARFLA